LHTADGALKLVACCAYSGEVDRRFALRLVDQMDAIVAPLSISY
jgi:hypothetical protein